MKRILLGYDNDVGPWVAARAGGNWIPKAGHTIALIEDDKIIAGVLFDNYNGASIQMHVAAVPGKRWMDRRYLWKCFDYPFEQLGVNMVIGLVAEPNLQARKFDEHLGFTLKATLADAHPEGDLLIYGMTKDQCKWLALGDRYGRWEK